MQQLTTNAEAVRKSAMEHKWKNTKTSKQIKERIQYTTSTEKVTQETVETFVNKIIKKRDELYNKVLAFPETEEASIYKKKNYQVFLPIELDSSRMHPIVCLFYTGAGPSII